MVKVIFGYVIVCMLGFSLLILLVPRFRLAAKKSVYIFSIAFLLCLPYLVYTYSLTGKVFYWTNSSSMSLFTLSTPYPEEYGEWWGEYEMVKIPHYKSFMDSIANLSPSVKDDIYKKKALNNIKSHPLKYLKNCGLNVTRILFNYPYSYTDQSPRTFFYLLPGMFVFVFMVISLGISIIWYKRLPAEFFFLLAFTIVYLIGSVLVSGFCRMFFITMPFWVLFFFYALNQMANIQVKRIE